MTRLSPLGRRSDEASVVRRIEGPVEPHHVELHGSAGSTSHGGPYPHTRLSSFGRRSDEREKWRTASSTVGLNSRLTTTSLFLREGSIIKGPLLRVHYKGHLLRVLNKRSCTNRDFSHTNRVLRNLEAYIKRVLKGPAYTGP